jgi:hypothetical protein
MYQYVPELEFCLDKYGVKPRYFGLYLVEKAPENSKRTTALKPHIDYGPLGSRINVPILNCQNTITEFYENVDIRYNQDPITGTRSYVTTNDDYRLIDSFTLSEPTLMNIKIGHKVVVPEGLPLPRIVLSIGPNKDISYMLDA